MIQKETATPIDIHGHNKEKNKKSFEIRRGRQIVERVSK